MSYNNFVPTVWEAGVQRDLERKCVYVEDCYRKYEGSVKRMGESVTIVGIGKPRVLNLDYENRNNEIVGCQTLQSNSIVMPIKRIAYYNYEIGDVDKAQGVDGVMEALQAETTEALANEVDTYIANLAKQPEANVLGEVKVVSGEAANANEMNVLDLLDSIQEKLMERDVTDATEIVVVVDPKFYRRFRQAYRTADTDNSGILKNGRVYYYNGMKIKVSNNVAKDNDGNRYIMARTKRAIAYVNPMTHTEAYRPEKKFGDALKGFVLYDAMIVRPKEMVVYKCNY